MANAKISDLTADTAPISTALLEIETAGGNSRKVTAANLNKALGTWTTATSSSGLTIESITLPGLTNSALMPGLKFERQFAGQGDSSYQLGVWNQVHKIGWFSPTGPLSAWDAWEPGYTPDGASDADPNIIGERHFIEVLGRDNVNRRLLTSEWRYGDSTYSGPVTNSQLASTFDTVLFADSAYTNNATISGLDGSASFVAGWINIYKQAGDSGGATVRRSIRFGQPGSQRALLSFDTSYTDIIEMGPFRWDASGSQIVSVQNREFQFANTIVYQTDGNVRGFIKGSHASHTFAVTDVGSTILGGLRNDGSFAPPTLTDAAAVNNSLYYSSTASKLVYKDASGTVNALY